MYMKEDYGKIIKSLGKPGDLNTEMHTIMFEYGFPEEFPLEVENFAQNMDLRIEASEINKRKDFRGKTTFTIDPITAKDFDDALSFTPLENGKTEIGIHIADVSHYVNFNSEIDKEALKRGFEGLMIKPNDNYYECNDGTFCEGNTCCNDMGGRKRCPKNMPIMCSAKICGKSRLRTSALTTNSAYCAVTSSSTIARLVATLLVR